MISELVKNYDPQNQFEVLANSYRQVEKAWETTIDVGAIDVGKIRNVVVSGLGGSAIGGDLIADFFSDEFEYPYFVNRNYGLPNFANENTLVIASSYSGNTEETLSAAEEALRRGAQTVCVTTGGKLLEFAKENNLPYFIMQSGFQPRYALYSSFFALLKVFQTIGLAANHDEIVKEIISVLKINGENFSKEENKAFKLAEKLIGFVPVIYGVANKTATLAVRMKGQFNENSKLHAFCNVLPEMNHNEIIGWESFDEAQFRAKVIMINDEIYHPQISKRIKITSELIRKSGAEVITLQSEKENFKTRLFDIVYLGDWISYYLAVMRKFDPSEIDNIVYLKNNL